MKKHGLGDKYELREVIETISNLARTAITNIWPNKIVLEGKNGKTEFTVTTSLHSAYKIEVSVISILWCLQFAEILRNC